VPKSKDLRQGKSWANPYTEEKVKRVIKNAEREVYLLGEVFFPTAKHKLDEDDRSALDLITDACRPFLQEEDKLKLYLVGQADFRAGDQYNLRLSERRANEVRDYIKQKFEESSSCDYEYDPGNWDHEVDPKGESESVQPGQTYRGVAINRGPNPNVLDILKQFRKVQIYSNKNVRILLGFEYKNDGATPYMMTCEMNEINNGGKLCAYLSVNLKVTFDELRYKNSSKVAERDFDQYLKYARSFITAVVTFDYQESREGGKPVYRVNAEARRRSDSSVLFSGSIEARAKIGKSGVWYLSSPPENELQVWRLAPEGKEVKDYKYAKKVVAPEGLNEMADELYDKLRGGSGNITERVRSIVTPKKPES
jgi:hypothetical protein